MKSLFGRWDFRVDVFLMIFPLLVSLFGLIDLSWLGAPAFILLFIAVPFGAVASLDICRRYRKKLFSLALIFFTTYTVIIIGVFVVSVLLLVENESLRIPR